MSPDLAATSFSATAPAFALKREREHLLTPQWPAAFAQQLAGRVQACFTTRRGGVSGAPWDSLNLGTHVGDSLENVARNRERLRSAICELAGGEVQGVSVHPVFMQQVHGLDCVQLDTNSKQQAADSLVADAAMTSRYGIVCTVMVADCLPLLFATVDGEHVAAAHAGWRGLLGQGGVGIIEATLAALRSKSTSDILVWLGPCIGAKAFKVGEEVRAAFTHPEEQKHFALLQQGAGLAPKYLGNLPAIARWRLNKAGIDNTRISGHPAHYDETWCTYTNELDYFSHRRDAARLGSTGRMAACVWRVGF